MLFSKLDQINDLVKKTKNQIKYWTSLNLSKTKQELLEPEQAAEDMSRQGALVSL